MHGSDRAENTRANPNQRSKKVRFKEKDSIMKFLGDVNLLNSKQSKDSNEFHWKNFIFISYTAFIPLNYWLVHVELVSKWGSGVAYSIALNSVLLHILDISMGGMALLYLLQMFKPNLPWENCKFEGHSEDCLPISNIESHHSLKCCDKHLTNCTFNMLVANEARYSTMDFYMGHMLKLDYNDVPKEKGFVQKWVFWLETIFACLLKEIPSELLGFAALSKIRAGTIIESASIYAIKVIFISALTAWVSICVALVQNYYNVKDIWCIRITGDLFVFSLIPDILQRWTFGRALLVLYYFVIFYWCFSVSLCVNNIVIEALLEEFPVLRKGTVLICIGFCLVTCVGNILLLKPDFVVVFMDLYRNAFLPAKALLIFLALMGLVIYTLERIKTDYYVTYGRILSLYCIEGTKLSIIILGALSIVTFVSFGESSTRRLPLTILILPVFLGMIMVIYQFLMKKRPTLVTPDPSWGSTDVNIRIARKRYDPTYDIRHGMHGCRHICMKRSSRIKDEVSYWNKIAEKHAQSIFTEKLE
ncbi:hypothetical protein Trydic_g1095 [Trypoxylus dichotomus]